MGVEKIVQLDQGNNPHHTLNTRENRTELWTRKPPCETRRSRVGGAYFSHWTPSGPMVDFILLRSVLLVQVLISERFFGLGRRRFIRKGLSVAIFGPRRSKSASKSAQWTTKWIYPKKTTSFLRHRCPHHC